MFAFHLVSSLPPILFLLLPSCPLSLSWSSSHSSFIFSNKQKQILKKKKSLETLVKGLSLTCLHCLQKIVSISVLMILIPSIFLHVPFNSFLNKILVLLSGIFVDWFSILHFVKFSSCLYLCTLSSVISKLSQRFLGIWESDETIGYSPKKIHDALRCKFGICVYRVPESNLWLSGVYSLDGD